MKYLVERYNLKKEFICKGELEVEFEGQSTNLRYLDEQINISTSELYHPIAALESLRKILESKHQSILAINGCRIDTTRRYNGWGGNYLMEQKGKPATIPINMFEPTTEIGKLGTIVEHELSCKEWYDSFQDK